MDFLITDLFHKKIPSNIKCFIWDVDGTLYQSKDKIFEQMRKITIDYVKENSNKKESVIKKHVYEQLILGRMLDDIVKNDYSLDKDKLADICEDKIDKARYLDRDLQLIDLFNKHLTGYKHAILTNSSRYNIDKILKRLGLDKEIFTHILCRDDLKKEVKPSVIAFKKTVKLMNCSPQEAMVIGDSLYHDIYPAKSLGIYTCFINTYDKKYDRKRVDIAINSPMNLIKFIRKIKV